MASNYLNMLLVLFFVVGMVAAPAPPPRPNFTGTWKVNFEKSALQIPAPERTVFVVEHSEPRFRLTRTHVFQGKSDTFSIELVTDGREVVQKQGNRTIYVRMRWEGKTLVFDSRIVVGELKASNLVRYEMARDGQSFTARERFRSPELNYDNLWVLEKQKE